MAYAADVIALLAAGASILYAHIAGVHRDAARHALEEAARQARLYAEAQAADPAAPEVDHGTLAPVRSLRLVTPDEAREQLLTSAMQRHPAGRRSQMSPHCGEETVPPAQVDSLPAPGRTPKS